MKQQVGSGPLCGKKWVSVRGPHSHGLRREAEMESDCANRAGLLVEWQSELGPRLVEL